MGQVEADSGDGLDDLVAARLRHVGQRYTTGRRVLIEALAALGRPATADDLAAERRLPLSTTYRNLATLERAGVVNRVIGGDDHARFELAEELTGRHHHHLVCLTCGSVEDFDAPAQLEQGLARAIGS